MATVILMMLMAKHRTINYEVLIITTLIDGAGIISTAFLIF